MNEIIVRLDLFAATYKYDLRLLHPSHLTPKLPSLRHARMVPIKARSEMGYDVLTSRYCRRNRALYVHMACGLALQNGITVMHDIRPVAHSEYDSLFTRMKAKAVLLYAERCAERVVTVSGYSANEIARMSTIPISDIAVIPNGWQHMEAVDADDSVFDRFPAIKRGEYLYSLGSLAPHKNMRWIIEMAGMQPDLQFVIAGKKWPKHEESFTPENIHYLGYVTDGENKSLMSNCRVFLHPSLYEGFGLTPLEAACCGAPILVSNAGSLPEVFGGYAVFFDPLDYKADLKELLARTPMQPDYSELLAKYSWDVSAEQWARLLRGLLDARDKDVD